MLRYINYDIVFQEIPNEVTLAINISNCPNHCPGCHSPYLMEDKGEILNEEFIDKLLEKYGNCITCICFMGGDNSPKEVEFLSTIIKLKTNYCIKTGWYSGKKEIPSNCHIENFDFIKLGPFIEHLGGLNSNTTNQHLYRIENREMIDISSHFHLKNI